VMNRSLSGKDGRENTERCLPPRALARVPSKSLAALAQEGGQAQ
jgi:hypothetical protein